MVFPPGLAFYVVLGIAAKFLPQTSRVEAIV